MAQQSPGTPWVRSWARQRQHREESHRVQVHGSVEEAKKKNVKEAVAVIYAKYWGLRGGRGVLLWGPLHLQTGINLRSYREVNYTWLQRVRLEQMDKDEKKLQRQGTLWANCNPESVSSSVWLNSYENSERWRDQGRWQRVMPFSFL